MKSVFFLLFFMTVSAFAEHDATYCGRMLDGRWGKLNLTSLNPEVILAVEFKIENGDYEHWHKAYAAVSGLTQNDLLYAQKAIKSSQIRGTLFCVKARWGGAAFSSTNIQKISLITDAVLRVDYMSSFLR